MRNSADGRTSHILAMALGCATFLASALACPPAAVTAAEPASPRSDLSKVFDAELRGDVSERNTILHDVVAKDPNNLVARSLLGQMRVDESWQDVENMAERARQDPLIRRYEQLRLQQEGTAAGQLALAKFCAKYRLADRAQFHWRMVLSVQSDHREAARALGLLKFRGRLMTIDAIAEQKLFESAAAEWRKKVQSITDNVAKGEDLNEALKQLRQIDDVHALGPLVEAVSGEDAAIVKAALESVANIDHPLATNALARLAVLSNSPKVRADAASALKSRELHEFVPQLIGAISTPIHVSGAFGPLGGGYSISFEREGAEADFLHHSYVIGAEGRPGRRPTPVAGRTRARRSGDAERSFARAKQQAQTINTRGEKQNVRVYQALRATTGQQMSDRPQEWWDWWRQQNGLYKPQQKPQIDSYSQQVYLSHECFLAGTQVWTDLGQRPIERLRAGDRVLTCDPETGVLGHHSVLATTRRPAEQTTRLQLPGEDLVVTDGHPLWVIGKGWQLARNVEAGERLRGVRGVVEVEQVGEGPGADVYNLVVDDVNNFFVGRLGVLAHDNTLRRPNRCDIPGHVAKK